MKKEINILGTIQHRVLLMLFAINLVSSIAEDRNIYLVLLEGEPVAFHQGAVPDKQSKRPFSNR